MVSPYADSSRDDPQDCQQCGAPLAGDNTTGYCYSCRRMRETTFAFLEYVGSENFDMGTATALLNAAIAAASPDSYQAEPKEG